MRGGEVRAPPSEARGRKTPRTAALTDELPGVPSGPARGGAAVAAGGRVLAAVARLEASVETGASVAEWAASSVETGASVAGWADSSVETGALVAGWAASSVETGDS